MCVPVRSLARGARALIWFIEFGGAPRTQAPCASVVPRHCKKVYWIRLLHARFARSIAVIVVVNLTVLYCLTIKYQVLW